MTTDSHSWVEEDREDVISEIIEGMIAEMTYEEMKNRIWDMLYEDLAWQEWPDIWMLAEEYAPDLYAQFRNSDT
jgi:hypothetical protein